MSADVPESLPLSGAYASLGKTVLRETACFGDTRFPKWPPLSPDGRPSPTLTSLERPDEAHIRR
jgi:hypothetical protein